MHDARTGSEGPGTGRQIQRTPKKAAASGWMGSALEYYDFFIYAQAAALIFPSIMFDADDPKVAIVASFATYGVGYVARPIGAFVLGSYGDKHDRALKAGQAAWQHGAATSQGRKNHCNNQQSAGRAEDQQEVQR